LAIRPDSREVEDEYRYIYKRDPILLIWVERLGSRAFNANIASGGVHPGRGYKDWGRARRDPAFEF
jgi:hypothetical protein